MYLFFEPRSVVLIGTSRQTGPGAYNNLEIAVSYGYPGRILPGAPKVPDIMGYRPIPGWPDLPEVPDLAVISLGGAGGAHGPSSAHSTVLTAGGDQPGVCRRRHPGR